MGIMKNKIFLFPLFLTLILSLTSTLAFADVVGSFSKIEGRVDILKEGETTTAPVKVNDNVSMGDIVRTKSDGKAELTFKDDTTVRLASETRMKIDEYVFNPDNSRKTGALGLFRGKVRAVVSKAKGGIIPVGLSTSSFNINTPTAIAGVKGSIIFVFHARGITGVIFEKGQGFVANLNMPDKIVNINAGQITIVKPDAPQLPPRPASSIEMAQHTKDTTPAEKPKEKKGDEQSVVEQAPAMEAVGGDLFGFTPSTDIDVILNTIAKTTTIPNTSTLLPFTETAPEALKTLETLEELIPKVRPRTLRLNPESVIDAVTISCY